MNKLIVFQHVSYEILGTLDPLLRDSGFRIRYVNFDRNPSARPQMNRYDGLVVLGGPMNVDETERYPHLATEVALIRDALEEDMPVLGICLGAQLLAKALGSDVMENCEKEIGWYEVSPTEEGKRDPLIGHFEDTEQIFQWHGDTFDIPEEAVHLATSPSCPNQAFRYGDKAYGFQFHLEVDEPLIKRWLRVPHHIEEMESLGGRIDPDDIRRMTPLYIGRLKRLSDRIFGDFVNLFEIKNKKRVLPSK